MARGRQPGLSIRMRCAETGDFLEGGSLVAVYVADGTVSPAFDGRFGYLGATYVDEEGRTRDTPRGRYVARVVEPGRFSGSPAPDHAVPADMPFSFVESSVGYIDVFCPMLPGAHADDSRRDVSTGAEKRADSARRRIYGCYIAASAAAAAAAACWLLPALYVLLAAAISGAADGLGAAFAARVAGWFAAGYLLRPWEAACGVASALGPCWGTVAAAPLSLAASTAAWAALYLRLGSAVEDRVLVRSPLLDSLPARADSSVYGSRELVRSLARIREELPTYDPQSGEPPEQGGVFVGFVDGPIQQVAPEQAVRALRAAAAARSRRRKGGLFGDARGRALPAPRSTMRYVYLPEFLNTILLGDTRAGKTRRILLATIDLQTRAGNSLLIIDPKGELYALTHGFVEERYGRANVNRLNFRDPANSNRHNFMQPLIDAANAGRGGVYMRDGQGRVLGDYARLASAANDLVKMLLPEELDVGNSKYFNNGARSIITSVCCAVASNVLGCPDDQRSLATAAMIIDRYVRPRAMDKTSQYSPYRGMLEEFPHDHPAVEAFGTAGAATDKELAQFCTTALTVLQDFRDQSIAQMTSTTDIPPAQLGRKPTVTYLIVPHEKLTYGTMASLYMQQAYAALIDESVKAGRGGRLPVQVTFLCEELGQIPPIPALDSKLTVSLGAGIRWVLVFQSMGQLIDKYEQSPADVIWGACDYKLLLKTTDTRLTGEYFRTQLGHYTCIAESSSTSKGPFSFLARSLGRTRSLAQRDVLLPEEVSQWSADVGCLVVMSKERGPYVVPLPDVSKTPTGDIIGINDPAQVARLYEDSYQVGAAPFAEATAWDPCLGQMEPGRVYTEEEFKAAEGRYLASLKPVQRKRSASAGDGGEPAPIGYVGYVNYDTGLVDGPLEVKDPSDVDLFRRTHPKEFEWAEIGELHDGDGAHKGWMQQAQVENLLKQAVPKARRAAGKRAAKRLEAQRAGRQGA